MVSDHTHKKIFSEEYESKSQMPHLVEESGEKKEQKEHHLAKFTIKGQNRSMSRSSYQKK